MRIPKKMIFKNGYFCLLLFFLWAFNQSFAQTTTDAFTTPGTFTWTVPACVTSITVDVWGGGGGGGAVWSRFDPTTNNSFSAEACTAAGGGGGGGYARRTYTVTPGQTYTIVVGSGGIGGVINNSLASNRAQNGSPGGNSTFSGPATAGFGTLTGFGGSGGFAANFLRSNCLGGCNINHEGVNGNGGNGGSGANGTTIFSGGNGAAGAHSGSTNDKSGGGGGGAGTAANGGNATGITTGGTGGNAAGGTGANGIVQPFGSGYLGTNGNNGNTIGGGGSGACGHNRQASSNTHRSNIGGNGARGEVRITYTGPVTPTFNSVSPICAGDPLSPLPITSNNGFTGSWSPALNNTTTTTYTFTPGAGQCANTTTLTITVNAGSIISNQPQNTPICSSSGNATLNVTANSGPYQWQYHDGTTWSNVANGTPTGFSYSNATSNALGITSANANCGTAQYRVIAGSSPCQAISNTATVTVLKATRLIPTGPQCSGTQLNFDACPSGATYSWFVSSPAGASASPTSGSGQTFSFLPTNTTGFNQTFTVNASITYQGLTCNQTFSPTIVSPPISGTLSGTTSLCVGNTTNLTTNGTTGGTWTSSNSAVATVSSSGVVTALSNGIATITYTVNATSPCAGSSSSPVDITVVSPPNAGTISGSSTLCTNGTTILTTDGNSGGTWSSSNPAVATVNPSGVVTAVSVGSSTITYTVNATAPCSANSSATFNITVSTGANAGSLSGNSSVCVGNTTAISSNGDPGGTWTSSNIAVATVNSSGVVTGVSVGTADVTYVVNAPATCSGSDTETITVSVVANANAGAISGSSTICLPSTTTLTTNGDSGGTWSSSNTAVATVNPSGLVTAVSVGSATITYTVNAISPCTTNSSATFNITISAGANAGTLSGTNSICVGSTTAISSNGDSGGTWTSSNTSVATVNSSGVVSGISAGSADITYTANTPSPCTGSDTETITITVIAAPNAGTISGSSILCESGTTNLTSNGTSGGTWSSSNTAVATVNSSGVVTGVSPGSATITYSVSAVAPCITNSSSTFNITVSTGANAGTLSGTSSVCVGSTTTISSNGNSGGTWTSSDPAVATVNSTGIVTGVGPGSATISYTSVVAGCSGSDIATIVVTVLSGPNAGTLSGLTSLCENETTTLTTSGNGGGTWSSSNSAVVSVNSLGEITTFGPGTVTITYSVTTAPNGCINSTNPSVTTISITVNPTPTVNVNNPVICAGQNATITAVPSILGGTFSWTPNGQNSSSITVSPSATSTYGVVYTINGCSSAVSSATVTVNSASAVSFVADQVTGCAPLTVNLTSTGVGTSNCIWNLGNGQTLSGCSVTYTFTQGGCYDISLSSISNGCTGSSSIADYICIEDAPIASFTSNPTVFYQPSETVSFFNTSSGASNYQWNFGDQQSSSDVNPVHFYQNTTSGAMVQLIAYSELGCADSTVLVIQYNEGEIFYVPNTFTPDGDEYNNTFFPVFTSGYDPFNFEMDIYDRWGELIFETHDVSIGWDGSYFNGRKCQDGIYTWKITYKSPSNDKRKVVTGHITLIR